MRETIICFWYCKSLFDKKVCNKEGISQIWKYVFIGISLALYLGVAAQITYIIKKVCYQGLPGGCSFTCFLYTSFIMEAFWIEACNCGCSVVLHTQYL